MKMVDTSIAFHFLVSVLVVFCLTFTVGSGCADGFVEMNSGSVTTCQKCPPGYYCLLGMAHLCPKGYSSLSGSTSCYTTEGLDSFRLLKIDNWKFQMNSSDVSVSASQIDSTFRAPDAFEGYVPVATPTRLKVEWRHDVLPSRSWLQH